MFNRSKSKRWIPRGTALVSFAAGPLSRKNADGKTEKAVRR
jgi:hypothetical protein